MPRSMTGNAKKVIIVSRYFAELFSCKQILFNNDCAVPHDVLRTTVLAVPCRVSLVNSQH